MPRTLTLVPPTFSARSTETKSFGSTSPGFLNEPRPLKVFIHYFFARPTDPPSQETGRWETKHFIGIALRIVDLWNLLNNALLSKLLFGTESGFI